MRTFLERDVHYASNRTAYALHRSDSGAKKSSDAWHGTFAVLLKGGCDCELLSARGSRDDIFLLLSSAVYQSAADNAALQTWWCTSHIKHAVLVLGMCSGVPWEQHLKEQRR